jgi:hypothetical protein
MKREGAIVGISWYGGLQYAILLAYGTIGFAEKGETLTVLVSI